jgi:glycosyltransferase involved in cell wall biosynthesis
MRLLIIGTHPSQTTGYSRVVYNIAKQLENFENIKCTIFGIQKFFDINDDYRLDLPNNVSLWDVYNYDNEDFGFGSKSLSSFILMNDPDVIMIYNDAEVIKKYIMNIKLTQQHYQYKNMFKNKKIKIVAYLDQVHTNQNFDTIKYISENTDHIFCFTNLWKNNYLSYLKNQNIHYNENKCSVVRHGITHIDLQESIDECKNLLGFNKEHFIFLNLNRYAVKKRLDISIIAFVKFLKKTNTKKSFLYLPAITEPDKIDILKNIYKYELLYHNITGCDNNLVIGSQHLSDKTINMIYKASDVGLNSCDGEGFGLCNYEHASFGKPQILSKLGGLLDYFNDSNSLLCEPKYVSYSLNNERSNVIDSNDMADYMVKYFVEKSFYNKHSDKLKEIPSKYIWKNEINNMMNILLNF